MLLKNCKIILLNEIVNGSLLIENGKIKADEESLKYIAEYRFNRL